LSFEAKKTGNEISAKLTGGKFIGILPGSFYKKVFKEPL
jgi:hypothetical protein